ncbi:MAG: hypothetical protein BA861_05630 [Desulfobacterales bacterium S3730MH5]|nr:MAG: hypothetical protein BA861_05630 [Desulfobacterales bacterium S3730MH5]OEU84828.1 MAG: hypothetical protein BA865_09185 [Desulfobacterales bacterium S5133MH4]
MLYSLFFKNLFISIGNMCARWAKNSGDNHTVSAGKSANYSRTRIAFILLVKGTAIGKDLAQRELAVTKM